MHPNLRMATLPPITPLARLSHPVRAQFVRPVMRPRVSLGARFLSTSSPLLPSHLLPRHVHPLRTIATTSISPGAMFSHPAPEPGADFNVVMVGAGVSRLSSVKVLLT